MKQRTFLSILCFVLISFGVSSVSAQTCMNNENFRPIITYQANLRLILSSLPSNVTAHNGFYKGSIGQEPDRVDVVGMCIPGSASDHCSKCIKSASDWLMHICPNQTDAYWWALDPTLCLVSYSNSTFSGSADYWALETQYLVFNNAEISSNLTDFKNIWGELILGMISETSAAENHYKAKLAALTPFQYIYALMQCTPDISTGDCDNCLRKSVDNYRSKYGQKQGGYVMRPICFFRWQLDTFSKAFANITLAPPPSPPLLKSPVIDVPQPPSAGDRDKNTDSSSKNISMRAIVAIVVVIVVIVVIIIIILALLACRFALRGNSYQEIELNQTGITTVRSLKFNFKTIKDATNKFSESNKLGQGGFGEVFKGMLPNGKEVAVKRLSRTSKQGEKEFKNEVVVVAKLQHRNLVRLLGFSVKGEERILVYEFVPNRSLDCFLSDPTKQGQLDWTKRYNIITGITRGILYLHQDSRLTIIHRDLKADNILLDANMNPKIADFGMARIFGMDQSVANTSRIAGTFGYMPPEYMNQGLFSMKSDVYSFGVLVLEIICGKKNTSFYTPVQNLVTYAWRLWRDGTPLELVDSTISESCQSEEVTRCIHIALLCVQEDPKDRPDLSIIMSMLTNNSLILPVPKPPGFFFPDRPNQSTMRSNSQTITYET